VNDIDPDDDSGAEAHDGPPHLRLYSVGGAARETGIAAETLRIWERRYGKPVPQRLPSGHRRFTHDQVVWLRRVADALARGVRASKAVNASHEELDAWLSPVVVEVDEAWLTRARTDSNSSSSKVATTWTSSLGCACASRGCSNVSARYGRPAASTCATNTSRRK
jgi:hypothetical protein